MDNSTSQPQRRSILAKLIDAIALNATVIDLLIGWSVWILILLARGISASASPVSGFGLLDYVDSHWENAFFWSLPVVFIISLVHQTLLRRPWHAAFTVCILYVGPISISHIGFTLLGELYHSRPHLHDAQQTMGLAIILFYLVGIAYFAVKIRRKDDQCIAALLVPPYIVAILSVAFSFFQVLTSVDYRYRNAFQLSVQMVDTKDGSVHINGTFHVTKPAAYAFSVIATSPFYLPEDDSAPATITWKGATPSAQGDYPFDIICKEVKPMATSGNPATPAATAPADAPYPNIESEPLAYLQISVIEDKDHPASTFVKSIPLTSWEP
ncbi:MAG: hypothetical protein WC205_04560 [Opitutaceae bacterium]|jgi:hypothetical protein